MILPRWIDRLSVWFWSKWHPCRIGLREYDHEWTYINDSYGADDVVNGWCECGHWECETCGELCEDMDPPGYDDFYDPAEWR